LEALKKEIDFHAQSENYPKINRCNVGVVLVYLHNGDPVEAGKFYQQSNYLLYVCSIMKPV
jgi:hypothetical protein